MLELLHIENIAIIEAADIEFAPGFNALTGETGAGKSIVIDSLSAVLGQRTSRELIRTGADKAFVSAAFSGVEPGLTEALGIQPEPDGTLLLQREIQTDGKNVCRINGRPVTVSQLRALGTRLLNIHGQHDGQQLLDEEQHIVYLDSFGKTEALINAYTEKYRHFTDIRRQISALQMDEAEKARRVDTLQYQIEELKRAKLKPGEEEELTARRGMLRNAEKFLDAVAGADYALNGDDSGGGALSALRQAQDALGGVRHLDDAFGLDHGISPAACITERGEAAFRALETETLSRYASRSSLVIACGGGVVTREENYALLRQNSTIVALDRPLEQLSSRGRPLSASRGVERLARERMGLYRSWANLVLACTGSAAGDAEAIRDALGL